MKDNVLILAELYLASELNQLGKVRAFHPTQEAKEKKTAEALKNIEELTGIKLS